MDTLYLCSSLRMIGLGFIVAYIAFTIMKCLFGVRVSEEEEMEGLDIGEHGQEAYPDFHIQAH